ncbi:hypothetical protein Tco_0267980 [Tanacetum coccineum]
MYRMMLTGYILLPTATIVLTNWNEMGGTTPEEHVSTPSYDPPPSGEDRMQLAELMSLCTNLQENVLDLEKAKTAQAKKITSLKKRVKQLEKRRKSRTSRLRRLRKFENEDLDADAEVTLVNKTQEINDGNQMFDTCVLEEQEIKFENASVVIPDELTLAQTLIEIKTTKPNPVTTAAKTARPKAKGIIFHDQEEQPEVPQVALDEEMFRNLEAQLQAELIEERGLYKAIKKRHH